MKRQDARDAREQEEPSQKLDRDFSGACCTIEVLQLQRAWPSSGRPSNYSNPRPGDLASWRLSERHWCVFKLDFLVRRWLCACECGLCACECGRPSQAVLDVAPALRVY